MVNDLKCPNSKKQTVATPVSIGATTSNKATEDRLLELKQLQDKGLISDDEAKKKRQEIIDSM